jgi:hypothetical protein
MPYATGVPGGAETDHPAALRDGGFQALSAPLWREITDRLDKGVWVPATALGASASGQELLTGVDVI